MKNLEFYDLVEKDKRESGSLDKVKLEFILEAVGRKKKVLDIGCNDGYIGELIIKRDNDVYGCDIVEKNLRKAAKRGLKVKRVDVENQSLPYKKDFFDVVILADVIEHVFDTDDLIIKSKRVLKTGGILILTTPNLASIGRRLMLLLGIPPFIEHSIKRPTNNLPSVGHVRYFTKATLKELLEFNEFKVLNIRGDYITLPGFKLRSLGKKAPNLSTMLFAIARK